MGEVLPKFGQAIWSNMKNRDSIALQYLASIKGAWMYKWLEQSLSTWHLHLVFIPNRRGEINRWHLFQKDLLN